VGGGGYGGVLIRVFVNLKVCFFYSKNTQIGL
jgi:hypothetical protein